MIKTRYLRVARLLLVFCGATACMAEGVDEAAPSDANEALWDSAKEPSYYLRCGATSWRLGEDARLRPDEGAATYSLEYEVSSPALLRHGDLCVVSRRDGRGLPRSFSTGAALQVPGEVTLGDRHFWPFRVSYPGAGSYRAQYTPETRTLAIAPTLPVSTLFSAVPSFGDTQNYQPLTPERWSIETDQGGARYALGGGGQANGAEYSLYTPAEYGDFVFKVVARTAAPVPGNAQAELAIVYAYRDPQNYAYMAFSAQQSATQLYRIEGGQRVLIATGKAAGLTDSSYHTFELWRHGPAIRALVDQREILLANEPSSETGKLGFGAREDGAFFDDPQAYTYYARQTDHYDLSLPSDQAEFEDSVAACWRMLTRSTPRTRAGTSINGSDTTVTATSIARPAGVGSTTPTAAASSRGA